MNVKKNPFYYINTVFFLVLSIYSLLVCINVFDTENIDMNAGLCAVIVSMVLCLVMYLLYVTRVRTMLAANPILKTSLEVISVLIFLTLSCVVRVYLMGEFELDITQEGIVLLCMFMAYVTARMLNQYGFITLMLLVPWPYLVGTYHYDLQELIQMAAVIAGICVLSVIIFAVRKKQRLRLAAMILFLIAVAVYFFYGMYQAGLTSVYVEEYKQYIVNFNKMFRFTQFEKYYYIAVVMAAIISGIRLFFGSGSANTLIMFIVNALCFFTVFYDLGPMYLHFMYPLLAMAAAGSLGTRPSYEDAEVQLQDNLENVQVKYNKKDVVGLSYVDDSELDRMLEDIEKEHKYIPHKNLSELSEENDEDIPVELKVFDSALSVVEDEKENVVSNPEPAAQEPVYEPAAPVMTPEPAAQELVYEPAAPVMTPEPAAQEPVYEPAAPVMTPEPIAQEPVYEPEVPVTPVPSYETVDFVSEPAIPEPAYKSVMAAPVYETLEEITEEPEQPETFSYEPEYHYEEEKTVYEPEYHYEEQAPAYEPSVPVMTSEPIAQAPAYEPEYYYEEEKTAVEQPLQESCEELTQPDVPVIPEPIYEAVENAPEEPTQPEPVLSEPELAEDSVTESKQPDVTAYQYEEQKPIYETISYHEPVYENFVQEESQNPEPQLLIKNPVSFDNIRDTETTEDYEFVQSKPMFETMASFFSNQLDVDNAPKFEMSQRDAASFDAYSAANEIYTPINPMDELFTNADTGLEFEEVESERQQEKPYNEDDELVEEPVVHSTQPPQNVTVPENIELGLDLGEELNFGQTLSFTDLYDTDNTSVFTGFEEAEELPETTVSETTVELPETEPVSEASAVIEPEITAPIMEAPMTEEITEPVMEAPMTEEITEPVMEAPMTEEITEPVMEMPVMEETMAPVMEAPMMEEITAPVVEEPVVIEFTAPKEPVVEPVVVQPEPVKQVNPFAKEDDFFDWSTYDGSVEEEPEPVVEETPSVAVKPQAANDFEEFVWTDEMIKQFSDGGNVTAPQAEIVPAEDDVPEVIEEIAATTVPESVFEPDVTVRVGEPSIQQVLVEKPIVQEVRTETPVQEAASPVSAAEEETPQYQVFQSSANLRFEEPEEPEEEEPPQYQVYQSSGNFRLEEPEEPEEEEPQYQVYQSSGNFQLEEEEEEIQPTLVTYGGAQQNTEPVVKPEEKPAAGNKFGDFEFDLDLPDFEPVNPTKR